MTEDLYREVTCRRCGQKMLAVASFCPHCGEVVSKSWIERVTESIRYEKEEGRRSVNLIPVIMGILIAGYFFYTAIEKESIQGLIVALLTLFFAIRSMFAGPSRSAEAKSDDHVTIHEVGDGHDDPFADKFFCENSGTKVTSDATSCPKFGMKFVS